MTDIEDSNSAVVDGDYGTVDEHGDTHNTKNTVHSRLRANSSIMQLKKILGQLCSAFCYAA